MVVVRVEYDHLHGLVFEPLRHLNTSETTPNDHDDGFIGGGDVDLLQVLRNLISVSFIFFSIPKLQLLHFSLH